MWISSDVVIHLGDTLACGSGAIFFVLRILPHFELICDLLLKKRTATCRICLLSSSREAGQLQCSEPKKTADSRDTTTGFPAKWRLRNERERNNNSTVLEYFVYVVYV